MDMSSGRNAAVSFNVKTEGRPVMELSASVQPEQRTYCNGIKIAAKSNSAVIGTYDVFAKLCKPAFIELTTMKHGSDKMYISRLGIQGLKNMEASILEADPATPERRPIGMARVKLVSASLLKVDTKYEKDRLHSVKVSR